MADIYLTKNGLRKNVSTLDASYWKSQGWSEETPASSNPTPVAPVAPSIPSVTPTTPPDVALPSGMTRITNPADVSKYDIKGQVGTTGSAGSYLYGVLKTTPTPSATPAPVVKTSSTSTATSLPAGMVQITNPADIANYDIKGQVGATGAAGSYLYGTPKAPTTAPVVTNIPSTNLPTPTLPQLTATQTSEEYLASVAGQTATARTTLQESYQRQLDDLKAQADAAQARIDSITSQQTTALGDVEALTQPFREALENAERERLHINENFEANQKLVNELDSLLTDGNNLVSQMKGVTGLTSIRDARVNQAIDSVNARVGVIQAVMNARNGQITQAYTMIDRTTAAITADKNDQLSYYNSLLNFYASEKSTAQTSLTNLTNTERTYINAQIGLLEQDLADTKAVSEKIKEAMTDPNTALLYAEAGVTLQDSIETISQKLSQQAYTREIATTNNQMQQNGYTYLAPGQNAPTGATVISTMDSSGKETQWYTFGGTTDTSFTLGRNQIRYDSAGNVIASGPIGDTTTTSPTSEAAAAEQIVVDAISPYIGSDGFISPETYNAARAEWAKVRNVTDFDKAFAGYRNPMTDGYITS